MDEFRYCAIDRFSFEFFFEIDQLNHKFVRIFFLEKTGESTEVQQLMKSPDTRFVDQNGNSALHSAAKFGKMH